MPISDLLRRNAREFGEDTALVEINPEHAQKRRVTWKEYELIEPANAPCYRREITWREFDEHANRFANLLLSRGLGKGKKVAILLMNCLEWLPIYFGILKAGALAEDPITAQVAAVSCGIWEGTPVLDLDYAEDSSCQADSNFVLTARGGIVEIQGTAEDTPFSRDEFSALLGLAEKGVSELVSLQRRALMGN